MTTKVVKGSLWTLAGQVAPLAVSIVTTPFVIRMLGAESYGVLILIGLIPTYLGFADFGMALVSTKFASEAYGEGDSEKEARVVRTAVLIATCTSVPIAALLIFFSARLVGLFNVPENLLGEATFALKISSVTFVINILNGIVNSPQLARLRLDLNSLISTTFRIAGLILTPIVIYWGWGIVGAAWVLFLSSALSFAAYLFTSSRLLPALYGWNIERTKVRMMGRMGLHLLIASIAGGLLAHAEKLILARTSSVESLAHYSVAFTFAMMASTFSSSITQSLMPAFSQLLVPDRRMHLDAMFSRTIRLVFILVIPFLIGMFCIGKTLITVWAGPEFGAESVMPFYVLLLGLFFNIMAFVPLSLLMASGKMSLVARLYWFELLPFILVVAYLSHRFGPTGAAIAWSARVFVDAFLIAFLVRHYCGISLEFLERRLDKIIWILISAMITVIVIYVFAGNWYVVAPTLCVFGLAHLKFVWSGMLEPEERNWISIWGTTFLRSLKLS